MDFQTGGLLGRGVNREGGGGLVELLRIQSFYYSEPYNLLVGYMVLMTSKVPSIK